MATEPPPADDEPSDASEAEAGREETPLERLDRNTVELLNELRVAGTGVQVLFGFLLIVPFNARFTKLSAFERDLYLLGLLCVAVAAILLIAPTIMHRLLFRHGQKRFLVGVGTRMMVVASGFLAVGLTTIVLLVSALVAGAAAAVILAAVVASVIASTWFVVPLRRRH